MGIGVVVLAVAVGGGIWALQSLLDWGQYRDSIAGLAAERLGRPVRIGGAVTLRLVPQPILQAADVSIDDAGDGVGLHARALRLRVGLGALLAGTVGARELTVEGAELRLPWPPPAAVLPRLQARSTELRVKVERSRLQVGGFVLDGIDAGLTVDAETGTLAVSGGGVAGGRRWQFTARLTEPGRDGAAGLDVSLDGQGALQDTGGTFSGQVAADGGLTGRIAGRGADLSALVPAPAVAWRGDGRLTASADRASVDDLALELGGAPMRGTVTLQVGALRVGTDARLDVALAGGRLDLGAWLPALAGWVGARGALPIGLDVSADAATLAGGTLRRARAVVELGAGPDGGIVLREVTAVLPGEATLALSGRMADAAHFDGTVRLGAPDLPTTVRWAQPLLTPLLPGVAGVWPGLPRAAEVEGQLAVDGAGGVVSGLHGTLDGSAVAGGGSLRRGARTAVSADLTLARLTLDPWVEWGREGVAAVPGWRAVDAELRLRVGAAEWSGVGLGALALDAQSDAGRIVVRRFEAAPMGARVSASGQTGEGGRVTDARLEAAVPELASLRPLLARLPYMPAALDGLLRGPGSLTVTAAGLPEALAGRVTAELGDLRVDAAPLVNVVTGGVTGALRLQHPGATRLLETLGLSGTAVWLGDGSFSLVGQVVGSAGHLEIVSGRLGAGGLRVAGQVAVEGRRVTGRLSAESLPMPAVHLRSPDPLPFGLLRGWSGALRVDAGEVLAGEVAVLGQAVSELELDEGVLTVRLDGQASGGRVHGTAVVDAAADPPRVDVTGQVAGLGIVGPVFGTPVDVVAGLVDATFALSGAGYSPAALLATVSGAAAVAVRDGVADGFDLVAAAAALDGAGAPTVLGGARQALMTGSTHLGRLDGRLTVTQGVIGMEAGLTETAGWVRLGGSYDAAGRILDAGVAVVPVVRGGGVGPELGVRLSGGAAGVTASPELAGLARWLAERPVP